MDYCELVTDDEQPPTSYRLLFHPSKRMFPGLIDHFKNGGVPREAETSKANPSKASGRPAPLQWEMHSFDSSNDDSATKTQPPVNEFYSVSGVSLIFFFFINFTYSSPFSNYWCSLIIFITVCAMMYKNVYNFCNCVCNCVYIFVLVFLIREENKNRNSDQVLKKINSCGVQNISFR